MGVSDIRAASLKRALKDQGRSVTWLARVTGYSRPYVSNMLAGAVPWTEEFQARATKVLGTEPTTPELYRGRVVRVPTNVYRLRADLAAGILDDAWKESWAREHGSEVLAAAAERALQQALAVAGEPA